MVYQKLSELKKPDSREAKFQLQCDFSKIIGLTKLYLAKFYAIVNFTSLRFLMHLHKFSFSFLLIPG